MEVSSPIVFPPPTAVVIPKPTSSPATLIAPMQPERLLEPTISRAPIRGPPQILSTYSKRGGVAAAVAAAVAGEAAGGAQVAPQAGGAQVAPQAGGAQVAPQAEGAQVAPQTGGAQVAPQAGGAQLAPQTGGAQLAPQTGGAQTSEPQISRPPTSKSLLRSTTTLTSRPPINRPLSRSTTTLINRPPINRPLPRPIAPTSRLLIKVNSNRPQLMEVLVQSSEEEIVECKSIQLEAYPFAQLTHQALLSFKNLTIYIKELPIQRQRLLIGVLVQKKLQTKQKSVQ